VQSNKSAQNAEDIKMQNMETGNRHTDRMFTNRNQKHAEDSYANDTKARADCSIHSNHFCV